MMKKKPIKILKKEKYTQAVKKILFEGSAIVERDPGLYLLKQCGKDKVFKHYQAPGRKMIITLGSKTLEQIPTTSRDYNHFKAVKRRPKLL